MAGRLPAHPEDCRADLRELAERRVELLREQQAWPIDLADIARRSRSAGLTITEIAEIAGVTRQTVYTAMVARERPVGGG
jgi:predicted transcriptional regulator